jgi:cytosine/adenosine deaminase-related metal-dependent hydrolase
LDLLAHSSLKGLVYLEVLGLDRNSSLKLLDKAIGEIQVYKERYRESGIEIGLSLHSPYSCHPDLLRKGASYAKEQNIPLCIHLAESFSERELLEEGKGDFYNLKQEFNLPDYFIPFKSPVRYLDDLGVLEAKPLLVHTLELDLTEINLIKESGSKVVTCPRSNHLLSCRKFQMQAFLDAGIDVFLGTDSLASSPSLNVGEELDFLNINKVDFCSDFSRLL